MRPNRFYETLVVATIITGLSAIIANQPSLAGSAKGSSIEEQKLDHGDALEVNGRRRVRVAGGETLATLRQGRHTFRFDTLGNEAFWGDTLRLQESLATLTPRVALGLGLKVDMDALPRGLIRDLRRNAVDLDDPEVTLELLRQDAVVGVTGIFDKSDQLTSVGVQCALCHSEVNNSVAPGIGRRLDGWANRDMNIGAIIASAPNLQPFVDLLSVPEQTVRDVLRSWGPGKFDSACYLTAWRFNPTGALQRC